MGDDDVELIRLRERVYGGRGSAPSADDIARLMALEDRRRAGAAAEADGFATTPPEPAIDPRDAGPVGRREQPGGESAPSSADGTAAERPEDVAEPPRPARARGPRPLLRRALTGVASVALVGLGVAIGFGLANVPASADGGAADLPELAFVQTAEDVISGDILSDSGIDPASIRYIATIRDFRIYLALPDDGDGRCIAIFTSSDNRPWSAGCTSGAQLGPAVFGVDEKLTVAIGDPADDTVAGTPIRLSESVTAYVRPN